MKHKYCVACGLTENLQHHHLVPKSRGGSNRVSNMITLCIDCHEKIHNVDNSLIKLGAIKREELRKEGKLSGGQVPYGKMRVDGGKTLIDNPDEQEVINKICELKVSLHCGSETIKRKLESLGYKARKGHGFTTNAILRILRSKGLQQEGYIRYNPKLISQ